MPLPRHGQYSQTVMKEISKGYSITISKIKKDTAQRVYSGMQVLKIDGEDRIRKELYMTPGGSLIENLLEFHACRL